MYTPHVSLSRKSFDEFYRGWVGRPPTDADFESYVSNIRQALLQTLE